MPHRSPLTAVALAAAALAAGASWGAAARGQAVATQTDRPGIVAGDARPEGDHAVRVDGGWMVAYDETIPGTEVTFRMIPVPGGTFRMGSPSDEDGHSADEGPMFEVTVEPRWMGAAR